MSFLTKFIFGSLICVTYPALSQCECLEVSLPSGIYPTGTVLNANSNIKNGVLKYTLDGSDPTWVSPRWEDEKPLNSSLFSTSKNHYINISARNRSFYFDEDVKRIITIGFASFDSTTGLQQCPTSFYSYALKKDAPTIPILSVIGNEHDLFDYKQGILNPGILRDSSRAGNCDLRGREHEREVEVTYLPLKGPSQSLVMGISCHGGTARQTQQKGIRLKSRKEYGGGYLNMFMFGKEIQLQECALKPTSITYSRLGVEDYLGSFLANTLELNAPWQNFVEVYINGIYHGLYTAQERINKNWLKTNMGAKKPVIVSSWNDKTNTDFVNMMVFLETADLTDPIQYAFIDSVLDLNAFIKYQILEQFIMNRDWPNANIKFWRDIADPTSKWKPIFYDGDAGFFFINFDPLINAMGESQCKRCRTTPRAGLLMRKLWANPNFRNIYIETSFLLVNGLLSYEKTGPLSDNLLDIIKPAHLEMAQRFKHTSHDSFNTSWQHLHRFLKMQPKRLMDYLCKYESGVSFEWE